MVQSGLDGSTIRDRSRRSLGNVIADDRWVTWGLLLHTILKNGKTHFKKLARQLHGKRLWLDNSAPVLLSAPRTRGYHTAEVWLSAYIFDANWAWLVAAWFRFHEIGQRLPWYRIDRISSMSLNFVNVVNGMLYRYNLPIFAILTWAHNFMNYTVLFFLGWHFFTERGLYCLLMFFLIWLLVRSFINSQTFFFSIRQGYSIGRQFYRTLWLSSQLSARSCTCARVADEKDEKTGSAALVQLKKLDQLLMVRRQLLKDSRLVCNESFMNCRTRRLNVWVVRC